ncbi:tyrosine-protein kinase receptor Tie-1-like [Anneissia japonica]|uniref:tyrosine-protein kinase receptor Tie-1-like n=1 Tax=Anneissia japonica TaxID=1529436 RepID=UPI001425AB3E|nr:tyrosine-protein kinase receptor Tie-1-like [Anneissia japonica]
MELNKIVIGTLLLWKQLFGIIAEQVDVIDFVGYTNYAAVKSDKDCDIINAVIHPDITEELYIGIALSPLYGSRYDETPEARTEFTEENRAETIASTLFPSNTKAWYKDEADSYNSFRIRIDKHCDIWDRVGVFYTKAVLDGFRTAIATLPLLSDEAHVQPRDRVVTVSVGDSTVTLTVETDEFSLRWRKDGGSEIEEWNDLSSVTINNVRLADAGIYECYVTGTRAEAKHAFIVLHVRTCPASRWSPPLCLSWCPVCYNGGVCDVDFGICLCTTGFKGDNCEICEYPNCIVLHGLVKHGISTTDQPTEKKLWSRPRRLPLSNN